jgi:hypothetical protein
MNAVLTMRIAAVVVAIAASNAAHAVYRCGNVFQDTPCDAAGTQMHPGGVKPAARGAAPAAAVAPATNFAATCARTGEEAQKMVWKREGGATQEHQLAELPAANREEMAKVLESVYRKRGSAPEIRSAIEAECVAEKQQAADKAALLRSLLPASGGTQAAAPAASIPSGASATGNSSPNPACSGWRRDLESINAQLRGGGNAAAMERLQAQRRSTEKSLADAHC